MFGLVGWAAVAAVVIALIVGVKQVVVVAIALHGVPSSSRAAVLRALAECFRWWRGGSP